MNQIWSLAIRNLLRNRRRSLATLLALAIGAASILIFGGYTTNVRYSMLTAYVRAGGHLQIQSRDFFHYGSGNPAAYGLAEYKQIMHALDEDPALKSMINVVTPMLQFGGIAGNYDAGVSRTVLGTGYVAHDVNRMRLWNEFELRDTRPHFALEGAAPDAAIVGIGVARVLLLCEQLEVQDCPKPEAEHQAKGGALPADIAAIAQRETAPAAKNAVRKGSRARIELLAGNARGTPNVAALSVLGAETQGFKELDEVSLILHLEQAQQLVYGRSAPRATSVLVQLHRTGQMEDATARIERLLKGLESERTLAVLNFETLNPFYVQTQQLFDTIFGFIFVLIGGIVLFTVGNTMNAAVIERTVEIGTLRAIGLRQGGIRALFLAEGSVIGCAGALLGVAFALFFAQAFNALYLTWIPPGTSLRVPLTLKVWGQWNMIVGTAAGLIAIAVASAWWPAYRAARLRIVDALRHA